MKIETKRLILREMTERDLPALSKILQDIDVMYAYEHAFSSEEVRQWLDRQLKRYDEYCHRFGLWAVVLKETDAINSGPVCNLCPIDEGYLPDNGMIGQCGLTLQDYKDRQVLEIGYLFRKEFWHQGYVTEAANACKRYAFDVLNVGEIFSIIRDTNAASQNVAIRNGMTVKDRFVKHYFNMDMPHLLFSVRKHD